MPTPLDQALEVLDRHWDDTFRYANPEARSHAAARASIRC